ncbi:MAG: monofunctional biosynthetic peptidoglycan transglycosylase [Candidatus Dadabacteria bacterium]|nr:monofunctional biosynthetic peptidoglycan transglycosylase [Candidatus Dadabacteria bacterium]NIV42927.1 monofunctional biosynthetic peptidoglycan transglycosylase [Candidatus Dadabacteria bacterium]NIX14891.1 monofunctional biosynthetic peptidoglycan transglycosylase [Candidatus Dadabacteria bacterium]
MKNLSKKLKKIAKWSVLIFFVSTFLWTAVYRYINPPFTPLMLARYIQDDREEKVIEKSWINLDHISQNTILAVLAAEDQSYFSHWGFDFNQINKSILDYEKKGSFRGASTISQQTAKNVFLLPVRSWLRKGFESYFTVLIEILWGKKRILEVYLNVAELGSGYYGVEAASNHYFGKSASKLNQREAAHLASLLPNPREYHKKQYSDYRKKKINWILKQMKNLGGTTYVEKKLK